MSKKPLDLERRDRRLIKKAIEDGEIAVPSSCPVCRLRHRPSEMIPAIKDYHPLKISWICKTCNRKALKETERLKDPDEIPLYSGKVMRQRKKLGLTQGDLSERAGVSIQTISSVESGTGSPTRRTLSKLALALGVEPASLWT